MVALNHGRDIDLEVQGNLPCCPRTSQENQAADPSHSIREAGGGGACSGSPSPAETCAWFHGGEDGRWWRHRSRDSLAEICQRKVWRLKLLLDTHILIWSVFEPRRIGPRIRRLLEKTSTELWLSPVSTWEIVLLTESGQIRLDSPFEDWLAEVSDALALNEAPLTHEVVLASREIQISHADPADRLLAATARYYDVRLVTSDERLLRGSGFPTLAN